MRQEEETIPKNASTVSWKHVPDFRSYVRGYSDIEVDIGFERVSHKLYELLGKLQSFPRPTDSRPVLMSDTDEEALIETMESRVKVLTEFEELLQAELLVFHKEKVEELRGLTKRGAGYLQPKNIPLAHFGT